MTMFLAKLDMFLANFGMLLTGDANKPAETVKQDPYRIPPWLDTIISAVNKVIGPILIVVATAGVLYAIVVGVKFVKADSKDEREEAKQKLISVIVGIVVTLVLIVAFYWLAWAIRKGHIRIPTSFNSGTN